MYLHTYVYINVFRFSLVNGEHLTKEDHVRKLFSLYNCIRPRAYVIKHSFRYFINPYSNSITPNFYVYLYLL